MGRDVIIISLQTSKFNFLFVDKPNTFYLSIDSLFYSNNDDKKGFENLPLGSMFFLKSIKSGYLG